VNTQDTKAIETFENYLRTVYQNGNKVIKTLIKHGKIRDAQSLPDGYTRGTVKECYANSQRAILYDGKVWYTEGLVLTPVVPFPIEHAWLTNENDEIVDLTLKQQEDCYYLGIRFERRLVTALMERRERFFPILWHPDTALALIEEKYSIVGGSDHQEIITMSQFYPKER